MCKEQHLIYREPASTYCKQLVLNDDLESVLELFLNSFFLNVLELIRKEIILYQFTICSISDSGHVKSNLIHYFFFLNQFEKYRYAPLLYKGFSCIAIT